MMSEAINYRRVARFVSDQVWAIRESKLDAIVEVVRMRAAGIKMSKQEIQARIGAQEPPKAETRGTIAVLPLYGVIAPKMDMMTAISGGTSLASFMAKFRQYRDDASISAVICDVDSPGGSVFMLRESFDEIFKARDVKPMVAVVNPTCCSAALYIASAFQEIVCTPSGEVGSVGTLLCHEDWSKANEMMGVKPTYIHFGKYKVEGNEDAPLEEEAATYLQSLVDEFGTDFVKAVAKGRGTTASEVAANFGQGRILLAKQALEVGMIDRIDTFENVLAKMVGRRGRQLAAAGEVVEIAAEAQTLIKQGEQLQEARAALVAAGVPDDQLELVAEADGIAKIPVEAEADGGLSMVIAEDAAPLFPVEREALTRELELLERL